MKTNSKKNKSNKKGALKVQAAELPKQELPQQPMCDTQAYSQAPKVTPDPEIVIAARQVERARKRVEEYRQELKGIKNHEGYLLGELEQSDLRLKQAEYRLAKLNPTRYTTSSIGAIMETYTK